MKKYRTPPMLNDIVQAGLAVCDDVLFDHCGPCPRCGGPVSGYDVKRKQFAILIDDDEKRVITVRVKRFYCRPCESVFFARQPFYPGTRLGSPVVDICNSFSDIMPYFRATAILGQMGVIVDRWSVRNYAASGYRPASTINMFGVRLPSSIMALSGLAAGAHDGKKIEASDILTACAFPSQRTIVVEPEE
jgi:hypothetical protein